MPKFYVDPGMVNGQKDYQEAQAEYGDGIICWMIDWSLVLAIKNLTTLAEKMK